MAAAAGSFCLRRVRGGGECYGTNGLGFWLLAFGGVEMEVNAVSFYGNALRVSGPS